jgi:hypothetical protein
MIRVNQKSRSGTTFGEIFMIRQKHGEQMKFESVRFQSHTPLSIFKYGLTFGSSLISAEIKVIIE